MTRYLAAYDVENPELCLPATRVLAELHRRLGIPATFFIVGKLLEKDGAEFREALDDPLFDVQTHTYSHPMLKDSRSHGPAVSLEAMDHEVRRGKELVEEVLYCGQQSGREVDKFAAYQMTISQGQQVAAVTIDACPMVYECKVVHHNDVIPAHLDREVELGAYKGSNYHRLYYGQILGAYAAQDY